MAPRARLLTIFIAILVAVGAGSAFFVVQDRLGGANAVVPDDACRVLSLDKAKKLLNSSASKKDDANSIPKTTKDLKVTYCGYATLGSNVQDVWTLSVEVRVAKTDAGATENMTYFAQNVAGGQEVIGYGDDARWDSSVGRLVVVKDSDMYLIRMVKGVDNVASSLANAQEAAAEVGLKN